MRGKPCCWKWLGNCPSATCPASTSRSIATGRFVALHRLRPAVPATIEPAVLRDLEGTPLPTRPLVPYVECVHDRIAIEIMRGCPWQCRFCQSSAIKRPLRVPLGGHHRQRGARELSPHRLQRDLPALACPRATIRISKNSSCVCKEVFGPLHVNISVPSLRVNDQLRTVAELIGNERRSSLTLAPEVARDDMREQIRKRIKNDDLYEGCRIAFRNNYESVKLYFMCGLPGERPVDLDGIVEMAETIARIGKEERGRYAHVTASVSNFVPKAHTPFQWNGMQTREYFRWAHEYLWQRRSLPCVQIKRHNIETSLLECALSRGDRRVGDAIELAWRRGARMDSWSEQFNAQRWWQALADTGIDVETILHQPFALDATLPWDHVNVKVGRTFLEKEQLRSAAQRSLMQAVARRLTAECSRSRGGGPWRREPQDDRASPHRGTSPRG